MISCSYGLCNSLRDEELATVAILNTPLLSFLRIVAWATAVSDILVFPVVSATRL